MMDEPQIDVARVLPAGGPGAFTPAEIDAILEVAYLATQADGDLDEEEEQAFRALATALGVTGDVATVLDRFAAAIEHTDAGERLAKVSTALATPLASETAYKVAFAMALCDLADNDEEDDFDDALVQALRLSEEKADELAAQVYEAIGGEDEEPA